MTWRAALAGTLTVAAIVTIGVAVVGETPDPELSESANSAPMAMPAGTPDDAPSETPAVPAQCTPKGYPGDGPIPTAVHIPKIGVNSSLIPLCLNPDGTIQVPSVDHPEQAGYYAEGYRPGDKGSAVILGHIDGERRLGVLHSLSRLTKGDRITVDRADGSRAIFAVEKTETVLKKDFDPKKIYGPSNTAELKIVSCGGKFDKASGNYLGNVISSAKLIAKTPAGR